MSHPTVCELLPAERAVLAPLFAELTDTCILSCLQGMPYTFAFADDPDAPSCAALLCGGALPGITAYCFLAGDSSSPCADALVKMCSAVKGNDLVFVPDGEGWDNVLRRVYPKISRSTRYALSKTEHRFEPERLREMAVSLPEGYEIRRIDKAMTERLRSLPWAIGQTAGWALPEEFEQYGLGFVCLYHGEPVGCISSFSAYDKGYELDIVTREDFRRRGVGRACAARMIVECLERGMYPSWDAATETSLALAQSLGYVFAGEYTAWWISAPNAEGAE